MEEWLPMIDAPRSGDEIEVRTLPQVATVLPWAGAVLHPTVHTVKWSAERRAWETDLPSGDNEHEFGAFEDRHLEGWRLIEE